MTRTDHVRSRRAALAVLVIGLGGFGLACSAGGSGDGGDAAPVATSPVTEEPIPPCDVSPIASDDTVPANVGVGVAPTVPSGIDTGYSGSGPGSGNPYLVAGARQVPGPDMTVTTLGGAPQRQVVVVPPNPDVGSPAAMTEGATTVPTPPTTTPAVAAPSDHAETTSTTGLMELSDDPGCVALPGDP